MNAASNSAEKATANEPDKTIKNMFKKIEFREIWYTLS